MNYKDYTTEDFLQDDMFREWVLSPGDKNRRSWEVFLSENPHKRADIVQARALLLAIDQLDTDPSMETGNKMWEGILNRIDSNEQIRTPKILYLAADFRRYGYYAAAVVVLGFSIWWLASIRNLGRIPRTYEMQVAQESGKLTEYTNRTEKVQKLTLPDGSVVVLNSGSKVSFEKAFIGGDRKVYLSGQGYFEVVKNDSKPFFVFANNLVTEVVGTRFTVNNGSKKGDISVAVKSGKVKVFMIDLYRNPKTDNGNEILLLTANQEAKFDGTKGLLTKGIADKPVVIKASEKFPNFNFERTAIEDVFSTLGNSYGVDIDYDPNMVANCSLTAELGDEPLFKKLDIICRTIDATYEVWGTTIIVTAKGCSNQ